MFLFLLSHSSLHIQFICIWFVIVVLVRRIALFFCLLALISEHVAQRFPEIENK